MSKFIILAMAFGVAVAHAAPPVKTVRKPAQEEEEEEVTEAPAVEPAFKSKKTGKSFAESNIEDITNENFPDMIESFDYPNAEITDVIKAISDLTGKNFIVDTGVRGKITIIAPSRITVAEAYKAFLSALAINGLAVVPGDGFYKIKQARQAQRDNIDTYSGAYYPTSDQMITRIVKLQYISADEVSKQIRTLNSKDGEMTPYTPTNSLIISDYGASVDRITKILNQLDVQGFEEQMEVIRIRFARAKEISDLIDQIINKGEKGGGQFGGGIPRFRRTGGNDSSGSSGAEVYSLVVADERTNSIIVVGNKAGIAKIRRLIARLDFPMRPDEQGGVFVYGVRYSEAEAIANTLNGIVTESKKAADTGARPPTGGGNPTTPIGPSATAIFGGDVKVTADKTTNSLIVVASKPDYEIIKNLLMKIDIPRDQVYIKAVIMEMSANAANSWGIDYYKFARNTNGIGRAGFRGGSLDSIVNPTNDKGAILGFGSGDTLDITIPGGATVKVTDFVGMLKLLKSNSSNNILSTPEIMALDNVESTIEVGEKVPVAKNDNTGTGGVVASSITRENVTTKLVITPFISPDTDAVQMKIDQQVADLSTRTVAAEELAKNSVITSTRNIKTQIIVNSGDTAVLGGLMKDTQFEEVAKIPVLGDIPILGWLFKSKRTNKDKTNLTVFLTPKIIRHAGDNATVVDRKITDRIDFIQKNLEGRDPFGSTIDALPRRKMTRKDNGKSKSTPAAEEPAIESF